MAFFLVIKKLALSANPSEWFALQIEETSSFVVNFTVMYFPAVTFVGPEIVINLTGLRSCLAFATLMKSKFKAMKRETAGFTWLVF